ncbi:MAG: Hsp20/alpha crystallin family protein [Deltaproteobacteria bacterium]|nr:Hsp20/alpha crystallin family protein [Deltaproteobacteria bacterium]
MSRTEGPKSKRHSFPPSTEVDRLFEELFQNLSGSPQPSAKQSLCSPESRFCPDLDLWEDDVRITIKADLPGVDPRDVELFISGDYFTISGTRRREKAPKKGVHHRVERAHGRFERTVELPCPVDDRRVRIRYYRGTLTVVLEKAPATVVKTIRFNLKN